ncbi:synaptonemal complex protein 2-like [Brachyistius frenatus]|uniref:synaptonemal complex protein 2-like n=1 Tax=Brachyistius frenatus TaxID=100188 RepID=UPI0037E9A987
MFEVQVDDCLLRGDSSQLVSLLHAEGLTHGTLTRLDQLVVKDLCGSGFSRVLLVLKSLGILSENRDDLQTLISHGLTAKVLEWFEAVRDLLTSNLQRSSAPLFNLTEEFFDFLLLLGQASLPVSQLSVGLLQLSRFTLETEIYFRLRLEAIRTFNSILESLNREQRRLIQNNQNQIHNLSQVAAAVLTVGDYELQVSLLEVLCRLTPRRDRELRANQWFSSCDISNTFCQIRDADFEVDCRRFLNCVNCNHGDQRRVYTFPCLRAFLSSTQLFRPKDEKLDEFWIDFNAGSGSVSFFIDEPQGFLWGSIHLLKEEVQRYSLQVKHAETVLSIQLNNPIMHHNSRGQTVELSFNSQYHRELEEAAESVFMVSKLQSSACTDAGGTVQAPPPADRHSGQSYRRKKPTSKSQLKVLPLSSPSSGEDSPVSKPAARSRAEMLFDQIRTSTPIMHCVPEGVGLQISQEQMKEFGDISSLKQEVFRKREAPDSGYLSDQTEGKSSQKKRVESEQEWEESTAALMEVLMDGVGSSAEEGGLLTKGELPFVKREEPVSKPGAETESSMTSDITASFKTFKAELEQHFTGCWKKVEAEVLLSLKECQQHVSSLLTAVHQHRLLLLQRFENGVTDQLKQLEENSTNLNVINTQILSFFQSEMRRLGSFCDEHLQRLKPLEGDAAGVEHLSSQ